MPFYHNAQICMRLLIVTLVLENKGISGNASPSLTSDGIVVERKVVNFRFNDVKASERDNDVKTLERDKSDKDEGWSNSGNIMYHGFQGDDFTDDTFFGSDNKQRRSDGKQRRSDGKQKKSDGKRKKNDGKRRKSERQPIYIPSGQGQAPQTIVKKGIHFDPTIKLHGGCSLHLGAQLVGGGSINAPCGNEGENVQTKIVQAPPVALAKPSDSDPDADPFNFGNDFYKF